MRIASRIVAAAIAAIGIAGCGTADDGGPNRAALQALVQREQACTTAADCCVVINGCSATAYVVAREDFETAAELAAERDEPCVRCMSPVVELRCEAGVCAGVELTDFESPAYEANMGDHCGDVSGEASQPLSADGAAATPDRVFGCGAD